MEPNHNIYSTFAAAAERYPDKTAVFYLGTRFTYRKIQNLSERLAAALNDNGVKAGQRVMMYIIGLIGMTEPIVDG